jgi:DNA repair protein RecN (Recombination protein N)
MARGGFRSRKQAMLQYFRVQNLAIVEEAKVSFGTGLNVISGETGAGKSVLIGALDLILGGRADKSLIRSGAENATVEAVFELRNATAVNEILAEAGLPPCEDGALLIRRTLTSSGAGRCILNDAPTSVQTLRRIGNLLVDLHGPYDHQSLLDPDFQLDLLDAFGRCESARAVCHTVFDALKNLQNLRAELTSDTTDFDAETDRLRHVIGEITDARLTPSDETDLVNEHTAAANAEAILQTGGALTTALVEGDGCAFDTLAAAQQRLAELARLLPEAEAWRIELQTTTIQIQELSRTITDRLERVESDAGRLQELEARMALVQKLKRRYGPTVADVLATCQRHETRLHDLDSRGERLKTLDAEIATAQRAFNAKAKKLSEARAAASGGLAKAITRELRDLGFLKAGFGVDLQPCAPRAAGVDEAVFGFAPNPGEPMRPLRDIASSGEIARVMLAVKAVLARHDRIPVLVFDEIDANIGGEVGLAVGAKLRAVAATHQVLCITHLPQVAVFGHQHYVVDKEVKSGRTFARIAPVSDAARADEIARMLGGKNMTAVTLTHAKEMLKAASK